VERGAASDNVIPIIGEPGSVPSPTVRPWPVRRGRLCGTRLRDFRDRPVRWV